MGQDEITSVTYYVIRRSLLFFLLWMSPILMVIVGVEGIGRQVAESRQEEDSAILNEWKDGNTVYRIIYMEDTKVKYMIMDDGGSRVTITPLYNADGTLQVYEENR